MRDMEDLALVYVPGGLPPEVQIVPIGALDDYITQPLLITGFGYSTGPYQGDGNLKQTQAYVKDLTFSPNEVRISFASGTSACCGDSGGLCMLATP